MMYSVLKLPMIFTVKTIVLLLIFKSISCELINATNDIEKSNPVANILNLFSEFPFNNLSRINDLFAIGNIANINNITSNIQCNREIASLQSGLTNFEEWALKMLDASSKIPSGILQGNMKDLGMYDECVAIQVVKNNIIILGRHCMYTISIKIPNTNFPLSPTLSICLPASCTAPDVKKILGSLIESLKNYVEINVQSVVCTSVESESWDLGGILTLTILGILIGFLVICTICDIFVRVKGHGENQIKYMDSFSQFSLYTNGLRILSMKTPKGSLPAIAGIRFLSMCWVIIGHSYVTRFIGSVLNAADILEWVASWNSLYILIAPFAVDTFFVMSGFLTAYLVLKNMRNGQSFNLITYYIHRYLRLTPAFGVLILLAIFILPRIGSGALWESTMSQQKKFCSENWWHMLLYIHNYGDGENLGCLGHSWYLAVDMQFFIISPLILYPLAKKPKIGRIILALFIIASVITPAVVVGVNKFSAGFFVTHDFLTILDTMRNFYVVSYTRAGPWLLGVFIGYMLISNEKRHTKIFYWCGWTVTVLAFSFSFFINRIFQSKNYVYNIYWEVIYGGISRHIWSIGVCWIIYASALGHGGIIGKFLSLPIFLPCSRISYSIYLVHYVIQGMKISAARHPEYFSDLSMINVFLSDWVLSTIVGFFYCLVFESPFLVMEKMLLHKKKPKIQHESREELHQNEIETENDIFQHKKANSSQNTLETLTLPKNK